MGLTQDAFELISLTARYVFAGLMLLIVVRAARLTAVDARRAAKLRRLSPMTGLCGEMVVLEGGEQAKPGMRYPIIREGIIGTSRRADVRVRHGSVRRRHAYFQLTEDGLHVRGHAGAKLRSGSGALVRELTLRDGDSLGVGRVHLLLVLSEATANEEVRLVPRREPNDALFDVTPLASTGSVAPTEPDDDYDDTDFRGDFGGFGLDGDSNGADFGASTGSVAPTEPDDDYDDTDFRGDFGGFGLDDDVPEDLFSVASDDEEDW